MIRPAKWNATFKVHSSTETWEYSGYDEANRKQRSLDTWQDPGSRTQHNVIAASPNRLEEQLNQGGLCSSKERGTWHFFSFLFFKLLSRSCSWQDWHRWLGPKRRYIFSHGRKRSEAQHVSLAGFSWCFSNGPLSVSLSSSLGSSTCLAIFSRWWSASWGGCPSLAMCWALQESPRYEKQHGKGEKDKESAGRKTGSQWMGVFNAFVSCHVADHLVFAYTQGSLVIGRLA